MEVLEELCEPSGPGPNEDAVGHAGDAQAGAAWVIDGATGVAEAELVPGADSDAAWFARRLSAAFASLFDPIAPVEAQMRSAIDAVAADYRRLVGPVEVPRHALPSAAGVWVRWTAAGWLELAALGDCRALLRTADGVVRSLGPRRLDLGDALVNAAVRTLQATGVRDPAAVRERLAGRLRETRTRMNRPGGYWVFSIEPAAAGHLDLDRAELAPGAVLLLVSDGLFRLVDTYRAYTPEGLVAAAAERGLRPLHEELRRIEAEDAGCTRFVRLKPRDDASGLLLRRV